jgi:hypothetical protein
MNKKGGTASMVITIILLVVLGVLIYFLYLSIKDITAEPVEFIKKESIERNQISFAGQSQFYPNMRFPKKSIIYNIDPSCSEQKKSRMVSAFTELEQKTGLLKFYNNIKPEKADILVTCEELGEKIPGRYFIAGEGGPTEIINNTIFYVIEKGKVLLLYKKSTCNNHNVELHELLHAFGFEHSNNKKSIMYNITMCNQILTDDIVNELKRLYAIEELPELYFSNIEASKHGIYLDFEVEIRNQGLAEATNITLELYSEEKFNEYVLNDINYGEGKSLEVTNVRLPSRKLTRLKFRIVDGKELNNENNLAELYLPAT